MPRLRMLARVLEPEVMDSEDEARDYDAMDHAAVNRAFVLDFLATRPDLSQPILDVGTGTAQIPIELCKQSPRGNIVALDAAAHMIALARKNVAAAGLTDRITPVLDNAHRLPYPAHHFAAVISNSIIHHIPDPASVVAEMVRVCKPGGVLFVRDLLRPETDAELTHLVNLHAAGANDHQRQMFADSLHAALTVAEVSAIVQQHGFDPATVTQTTDRHWTWSATAH